MNKAIYNITNRKVLHKVAQEVTPEDDITGIVSAMFGALNASSIKGLGIAAPQIGISKRVIILIHNKTSIVLVNPEITRKKLGVTTSKEGCLSYPDKFVKKKRYKMVYIKGTGLTGEEVQLKLRGLDAFVAQHEIDHLNGITIGDK